MYPSLNTPEFQTESLNVFRTDIQSSDLAAMRAVFLAFCRYADVPWPIVSATVWIDGPYLGHTMDMIQTHEGHRSEGLAKELWLGIEEYLGSAVIGLPEDKGIALSVAKARERIGRMIPDRNDPAVQEQIMQAYLRQRDNRTENKSEIQDQSP